MDGLLQKYNDYMRLVGCKVHYELADGSSIQTVFKEENFLHLLGLHKLKDIQTIQFWLDRNNKTVKLPDVIKRIKEEEHTQRHFFLSFRALVCYSMDWILGLFFEKEEYIK